MDEFTAVSRARTLVKQVDPKTFPVSLEAYVEKIEAVLRYQDDLGLDEPGWSFENNGKHFICVNDNDRMERKRFTICHEIAHIVLGLPSDHGTIPSWNGAKRSVDEMACDVFAAELLLPFNLFKPMAERMSVGFDSIDDLAARFGASTMATASRFATIVSVPCAYVLSEHGKVRYASRSTSLRDAGGWIAPRSLVPPGSLSARARAGETVNGPEEIEADVWLNNWARGGVLFEEARHLGQWNQTLTLLWFEDEEVPTARPAGPTEGADDELLKELDGVLPWPGKHRRK